MCVHTHRSACISKIRMYFTIKLCACMLFLFFVGWTLFILLSTHTHTCTLYTVDRVFILSYRMLKSFPGRHHKCFIVSVNWNSPCVLISNDLNYSDTCSSVFVYAVDACTFPRSLDNPNVYFWFLSECTLSLGA